jgi:hypothetical protein
MSYAPVVPKIPIGSSYPAEALPDIFTFASPVSLDVTVLLFMQYFS